MNVKQLNTHLARGEISEVGMFPHLAGLEASPIVFRLEAGPVRSVTLEDLLLDPHW